MLATTICSLTLMLSPAVEGVTLLSEFAGEGTVNVVRFPELLPVAAAAPPADPPGAATPACECAPSPALPSGFMAMHMASGGLPFFWRDAPLHVQRVPLSAAEHELRPEAH